ncbi:hypothetical protein pEaSNUABM37_00347 [Erwinia phage pEa_SNUABM_37]|nr:hypothetical protein pEaSNUABM37_00347 [Erwinia phage pEa_SNUABM_37]QXO10815.1 hypothetical protein pEaSNUABM48_00347 [Erwinia phage pEa_SNUABM_48]
MTTQTRREFIIAEVKRLQTVIFECRYACRMTQRDQYDVTYLEERGIPVTGIDWIDALADEQQNHVLLTIDRMVELCDQGINFWLDDPSRYAGIIYKSITDYILYYAELSDIHPNLPLPDQDDFERLDDLAKNIYKVYRCYETEIDTGGFISRLRNGRVRAFDMQKAGMINMGKPILNDDGSVPQKEHQSQLATAFGYRYRPRKEPTQ